MFLREIQSFLIIFICFSFYKMCAQETKIAFVSMTLDGFRYGCVTTPEQNTLDVVHDIEKLNDCSHKESSIVHINNAEYALLHPAYYCEDKAFIERYITFLNQSNKDMFKQVASQFSNGGARALLGNWIDEVQKYHEKYAISPRLLVEFFDTYRLIFNNASEEEIIKNILFIISTFDRLHSFWKDSSYYVDGFEPYYILHPFLEKIGIGYLKRYYKNRFISFYAHLWKNYQTQKYIVDYETKNIVQKFHDDYFTMKRKIWGGIVVAMGGFNCCSSIKKKYRFSLTCFLILIGFCYV